MAELLALTPVCLPIIGISLFIRSKIKRKNKRKDMKIRHQLNEEPYQEMRNLIIYDPQHTKELTYEIYNDRKYFPEGESEKVLCYDDKTYFRKGYNFIITSTKIKIIKTHRIFFADTIVANLTEEGTYYKLRNKYTTKKGIKIELGKIYKKNHRIYTITEVKQIGDKIIESGIYIKKKKL